MLFDARRDQSLVSFARIEPDVTFAALMQPHLQQAREQALSSPVVLLVQDTTDIDLPHRRKISGVGHIGNARGRGFFVQTVLAIGTPPTGSAWVHVGERGADMVPFFQACRSTQTHFQVRAGKPRRVQESQDEITYALTRASRPFEVPSRHGHPGRWTPLQLAFGHLMRLLGLLSPRAARLLQVRASAREDPERPTHEAIEPLMLAVLAQRCGESPATMALGTF